jgi:hypothetical protein
MLGVSPSPKWLQVINFLPLNLKVWSSSHLATLIGLYPHEH